MKVFDNRKEMRNIRNMCPTLRVKWIRYKIMGYLFSWFSGMVLSPNISVERNISTVVKTKARKITITVGLTTWIQACDLEDKSNISKRIMD